VTALQRASGSVLDPPREIAARLVSAGDVVLDVGANVGDFATYFASLVGPAGRVHAFEPNPLLSPSLGAAARMHPNIAYHAFGLSSEERPAELHVPENGGRLLHSMGLVAVPAHRSHFPHVSIPIRLRRLDEVLAFVRDPIALIKCDVEGHEFEVLKGGERILRAWLPALLLEIEQRHQDEDIARTVRLLEGFGYRGYGIRNSGLFDFRDFDIERDQLSLAPSNPADLPGDGYVNTFVFVRPEQGEALRAPS
jgi:FkbM family methyltransferase